VEDEVALQERNNNIKNSNRMTLGTPISHPIITKESCYNIQNSNWITFGINLQWHRYL